MEICRRAGDRPCLVCGLGILFRTATGRDLEQTVGDLQHSLKDMSRNVVDTTMGIERDLRRRQALLDTKSRVVQAKSELFDKNFGEAAKQLAEGWMPWKVP